MNNVQESYVRKAKLVHIVDGDTLDMQIDLGFHHFQKVRVHLKDVNAPEIFGVSKDSEEYSLGVLAKDCIEDWFKDLQEEGHDHVLIRTFKGGGDWNWQGEIWCPEGLHSLNDHMERRGFGILEDILPEEE